MKYRYPFTNEIVFSLVMQNPKFCQGILQMIFPGRPISEVKLHDKQIEVEKSVAVGVESRKVRLDVLFEDDNAWYECVYYKGEPENPVPLLFAVTLVD